MANLDLGLSCGGAACGCYSLRITSNDSGSGLVGAELFDATPSSAFGPTTARLINLTPDPLAAVQ